MNKFWIILGHTYMTKFKTKSFLISTAITLLFIVGFANFQSIMDAFSDDSADEIAVIDESDTLFEPLKKSVENANEDIKLVRFDGSIKEAKQAVQDEKFQALIALSLNEKQLPEATYYANTIAEEGEQKLLQQQLQQLKVSAATQQAGIDQSKLTEIYSPVKFNTVALDEDAKTDEELSQARGIVYIMLFLLYITVMVYGQMIAMDVATEKTSRVMEILVSSVSPVTQMFAKIIGIALLGMTQIVLIIAVGYVLIKQKQDELTGGLLSYFGMEGASVSIFVYAIVFFVLGYLLYATMAAMLGSLVSRIEDVQQLIMPMMLLIIAAFIIAVYGLNVPNAGFVTISSYIPFFSPMLMFLRVGMLDVPVWEVVLSIGILVATIIIFGILGARVYKGGVLMYGKSSSLKDFKKALQLSKKE